MVGFWSRQPGPTLVPLIILLMLYFFPLNKFWYKFSNLQHWRHYKRLDSLVAQQVLLPLSTLTRSMQLPMHLSKDQTASGTVDEMPMAMVIWRFPFPTSSGKTSLKDLSQDVFLLGHVRGVGVTHWAVVPLNINLLGQMMTFAISSLSGRCCVKTCPETHSRASVQASTALFKIVFKTLLNVWVSVFGTAAGLRKVKCQWMESECGRKKYERKYDPKYKQVIANIGHIYSIVCWSLFAF